MSEKKIIATRIAIFQNGRRNKTHEAKLPFYIGNAVIKKPWQTGNNVRHWATRTLFSTERITHHLYVCVCDSCCKIKNDACQECRRYYPSVDLLAQPETITFPHHSQGGTALCVCVCVCNITEQNNNLCVCPSSERQCSPVIYHHTGEQVA